MWMLLSLLVIFAIGWWFGQKQRYEPVEHSKIDIAKSYFTGINYLLNEQNDKAVDMLIKSLMIDSDTIETHLTLGSLFRRRGEITRAIRIHQNLIARPTLSSNERAQAEFALAHDYLAAGVLDRAEQRFIAVAENADFQLEAWQKLLDIYQREKRWQAAIDIAKKLHGKNTKGMREVLAHYYCELAQQDLQYKRFAQAEENLKQAQKYFRRLVRIDLLLGDVLLAQNNPAAALKAYRAVQEHDADYLSEAIPKIVNCYQAQAQQKELEEFLTQCLTKTPRTAVITAYANLLAEKESLASAIHFLQQRLNRSPSLLGLMLLLDLQSKQTHQYDETSQHLDMLHGLSQELLKHKPFYRCQQCGFAGRILFWQCPGCKHWGSIKPIQGVEGE